MFKMTLPEAIRLLNEDPSASGGLPPCEFLTGETMEAPQTIKSIGSDTGCGIKLDGAILLLKTML